MADLIIRGMEMPKSGYVEMLLKVADGEVYYNYAGKREIKAADYIPLPAGHGRLIDAERFRVILCRLKERQNDDVATHALKWAIECLDKMDTIVPAEGGTDDGNRI